MEHPFETHDQDLVACEVVWPAGVKENGREYPVGSVVTLRRGHAAKQNRPGRETYRVIKTLRYHKDPDPEASYEQQVAPQPLDVTGDGIQ